MTLPRAALLALLAAASAAAGAARADEPLISGPRQRRVARATQAEPRVFVTLGSLVDRTRLGGPDFAAKMRAALNAEIAGSTEFTDRPGGGGYAIDASITRLEHRVNGKWDEITCEVSFVVERLPGRSIYGMTSVTAMVQSLHAYFQPEMEPDLQQQALEAAIHGAQANLASIMKRPRSSRR